MSGGEQFLQGLALRAIPLILKNAGRTVPQRKDPRMKSFSAHKLICTGDVLSIVWDKEGLMGIHSCCRGACSFPGNHIRIAPNHPLIPTVRKMLSLPSYQHKSSGLPCSFRDVAARWLRGNHLSSLCSALLLMYLTLTKTKNGSSFYARVIFLGNNVCYLMAITFPTSYSWWRALNSSHL